MVDPEVDYDGLTLADALKLCVRRHEALSASQLKFINKAGTADKLTAAEVLRLAAIVRGLRQGDLIADIAAAKPEETT